MINRKRTISLIALAVCGIAAFLLFGPMAEREERPSAAVGPFEKYEPTITLTAVRNLNDSTVFREGESLTDNVWSRDYLATLGIQIKYLWTTNKGTEDYNQRLKASILTGELPDIFEVDSLQLKQLTDAGLIEDLTEAYERHASPKAKEMIEEIAHSLDTATFDGKLMAIPQGASMTDQSQVLWVRHDWLDKLNLPEPRTMQDILLISKAFAEGDPDGNGQRDTYGLGLNMGLHTRINWTSLKGFFNGFHAYPSSWIKGDDGRIVFGGIQPEVKTALTALRDMYLDGQIDPEFSVKDQNYMAEELVSGKIGMQYGAWWNPTHPLQASKDRDPGADWRAYGIPSVDDVPAKFEYNFPIYSYFVAKKGIRHPEALMRLLNLMVYRGYENPEWSHFFIGKDGFQYNNYPLVYTWPENGSMKNYIRLQSALKNGNPAGLSEEEQSYYDNIVAYRQGDNRYWFEEGMYGQNSAWTKIMEHNDSGYIQMNEFYGPATKTMSQVTAILDKLTLDTYTMIIMGELPIDAFDDYAKDWGDLGGDRITEEVNQWVDQRRQS
ncbi:extracellular solute-binding protein [Cohnella cellulosilytica]|uniref:Extracellular solute-binding protein n=1 Tax=Cohnella cellulosilytica TaxID=986710 RepID=A0ABW2FEE8_9BACL